MDSIEGVTPLTQAEFAALSPKRAKVPAIRASHHRMATLHAAGFTAAQISDLTGRSLTDIRNYPKVPANAELISQKQIELLATDEEADPAAAKLKAMVRIHVRALDRLYDLVDDDANELSAMALLRIAGDMADRTGYGRQTTQVNLNLDLGARLQKAREAQAKLRDSGVVELDKSEFRRRA